ncbi:hypothetical protein [Magnetospirillum sp. ME-1]|uniref:hypothetical protein n=1 Tax=Magnetospirillum sp. ME-1 TaxID=1639348 RepID=UPI001F2C3F87|nr:hypothetical protein [Magnetospirillum sp. ME-1]
MISKFHGDCHWQRVALAGLAICSRISDADPLVTVLFALFHDCRRIDEGHDPDHGFRSAELAARLFDEGLLPITTKQAELLQQACADHSWAKRSDDPTLGACWDADRIDLRRFDIALDPALMSCGHLDIGSIIAEVDARSETSPGWERLLMEAGWRDQACR